MTLANHFELRGRDGDARTGILTTPHGQVRTPAFMPVGTLGAMKGMHWRDVRDAGSEIVLGNTYHLMLRPGAERVAKLGGLQTFTGWNGPMLTDSGGFQVMSLAQLRKVKEHGVTFRSHIDGAAIVLTPERAIEVQRLLGSDIAMQLDECVRLPAERADIERAMQLSLRWAERSKRAFEDAPAGHMLFGIVQGGDVPQMRHASAQALTEIGGRPVAVRQHQDEAYVDVLIGQGRTPRSANWRARAGKSQRENPVRLTCDIPRLVGRAGRSLLDLLRSNREELTTGQPPAGREALFL